MCIKVYNYTKSLNIFISGRSNFAFHCLHLTFLFPLQPWIHFSKNIHSLQATRSACSLPKQLCHYSYCPTSPSSSIIHHQPPTYHFQVPIFITTNTFLLSIFIAPLHTLSTTDLRYHPEPQLFTLEQRQILLKYFDECGMTSTHRRNTDIVQRCANEVGTTVERVKVMRWGGR